MRARQVRERPEARQRHGQRPALGGAVGAVLGADVGDQRLAVRALERWCRRPIVVGRTTEDGLPTASSVAAGTVEGGEDLRRQRGGPRVGRGRTTLRARQVRGRRGRRVGGPGRLDHDHGGDGGHHQHDRDQGREDRMAGAEAGPGAAVRSALACGVAGGVGGWRWRCCWSWMLGGGAAPGATAPWGISTWCVFSLDLIRGWSTRRAHTLGRLETEAGDGGLRDCMMATPRAASPTASGGARPTSAGRARRTEAGGTGGRGRRPGARRRCPRRRRMRRGGRDGHAGPPRRPPAPRPARAPRVPGCPCHRWRRAQFTGADSGSFDEPDHLGGRGVGAGQHGVRHEAADDRGSDDRRQTDPPPHGHAIRLRVPDKHAIRIGLGARTPAENCRDDCGGGSASGADGRYSVWCRARRPRRTTMRRAVRRRPGPARRRRPCGDATGCTRRRSRRRTTRPPPGSP